MGVVGWGGRWSVMELESLWGGAPSLLRLSGLGEGSQVSRGQMVESLEGQPLNLDFLLWKPLEAPLAGAANQRSGYPR